MSIEEKLINIAENIDAVYTAGRDSVLPSLLPLYYISIKDFQWHKVQFPENFDFVLRLAKTPSSCNALLSNAVNVKTVKLECDDKSGLSVLSQTFREIETLETVDLTNFNLKISNLSYFAYGSKNIKTILGKLDLTKCSSTSGAFTNTNSLETVEFKSKTIKSDLDMHWSTKLSHESLLSILNGLYNYNVDIDVADCRPDYATEDGLLVPGIYEITEIETIEESNGNMYVSCTTEPGYMFRVYMYDCGSDWETVLDGMRVGNYIDFSGSYNADGNFVFDSLRIQSNPNALEYTLNLGATNLEKLTDEEKQIAFDKGWTLK